MNSAATLMTSHHMNDAATLKANARSDPTDAFQMVVRSDNGVHPGIAGQGQIADVLWAWLKYQATAGLFA
jgi:hypothetical protein